MSVGKHSEAIRWHRENNVGKPCPYCGAEMETPDADHIVPQAQGGKTTVGNIMFICRPCNADKADLSLPEWYWQLQLGGDRRAGRVKKVLDGRGDRLWQVTSKGLVKAGGSAIEPSGWGK